MIFVVLELFCFLLIVRYNKYQNVAFLNSSNQLVGTIFSITAGIEDYFILKSKNEAMTADYTNLQMKFDDVAYHYGQSYFLENQYGKLYKEQ